MDLLEYEFDTNKSINENTSENVERILEKVKNMLYNFKEDLNQQHFKNLGIEYFQDKMFEKPIDDFLERYKSFLLAETEAKAFDFLAEWKDEESYQAEIKAA